MTAGSARHLEVLYRAGAIGALADPELLAIFREGAAAPAELAFAELVARHGPLVRRVARAILANPHDADDAFQATFLILARRADSIRDRSSAAPWLFGVATRVARRARVDAARRRKHEARGAALAVRLTPPIEPDDLTPILLEEVGRLHPRDRAAIILCDLEGLPHADAARRLSCPLGTLKARLHRARLRLRSRLARRGLSDPFTFAVAAPPAIAPALARDVARMACRYASDPYLATAASGAAVALARGVTSTMISIQLAWPVASLVFAAAGAAALAFAPAPPAEAPPPELAGRATRLALEAAAAIADPVERAEILTRIGANQAERGERDAARATLAEAREVAATIRTTRMNASEVRDPKARRRPVIAYEGDHPIIKVVAAQAKAGDREAAHETAIRAVGVIEGEDNEHGFKNWPRLLAVSLAALGRSNAQEIVDLYENQVVRWETEPQSFNLNHPYLSPAPKAGINAMRGDFAVALKRARAEDRFRKFPSFRGKVHVALALAMQAGDGDRAGATLDEMLRLLDLDLEPSPDAERTRLEFSRAAIRMGRLPEALSMLRAVANEPIRNDWNDSEPPRKADVLLELAEAYLARDDRGPARIAAFDAIEVLGAIGDDFRKPEALAQAAEALVRAGDAAGAVRVPRYASRSGRPAVLARVARALRDAGDEAGAHATWREALRLAEDDLAELDNRLPATGRHASLVSAIVKATEEVAIARANLEGPAAALGMIDRLADPVARRAAWIKLAGDRARAGDLEGASGVVGRIDTPEAQGRAWIEVASSLPPRAAANR